MLTVNGITKYYDRQNGIENIHFSCQNGEAAAVIGPNGAGKSTLLRILAGVLKADAGSVMLDGCDTGDYKSRRQIGYMPDQMEFAQRLTVKNFLNLVSDYKFGGLFKEELEQAVVSFGLEAYRNQALHKLSMGNRKKTAMIAAFLGSPRLIILDEPTNGVDTSGIIALKQAVRTARDSGSIIIVSSHILDFLGSISDHYIFLKDGRIAAAEKANGNPEDRYRMLYLQ